MARLDSRVARLERSRPAPPEAPRPLTAAEAAELDRRVAAITAAVGDDVTALLQRFEGARTEQDCCIVLRSCTDRDLVLLLALKGMPLDDGRLFDDEGVTTAERETLASLCRGWEVWGE